MGLAVTKQEAFWEACGYGRIFEVKKMLDTGTINVNWKSYTHDCCPIHVASQGKKEIVELLLAAKCDVNVRDDRDNLAIHHAAMKGHADIIQLLLDAGSKIDAQDKMGWTSLIVAAYWCCPEVCKVLVNNKCNVHLKNRDKRTALHEVCRSPSQNEEGLAEIASLLVECGLDLDSKNMDTRELQTDFTPLMFCAYHGHAKVAKVLIDADCKINDQAANGWSALHWAADRGHMDVVEVLLHGGIDCFLKATRGELAIDRSSDNKIVEMISEAMQLNGTEHKIAMETRGSLMKNLYIPTAGAQCNYNRGETDLSTSPRSPNLDVETSPVFQSMKAQMVSLSDQHKTKKTRRVERKISQRIFEPPKPPADSTTADSTPSTEGCSDKQVIDRLEEPIGFMDDPEEAEEEKEEGLRSDLSRDQSENTLISNSQSNDFIQSSQSFSSTDHQNGIESQNMLSHDEDSATVTTTNRNITGTCQAEANTSGQSEEPNTGATDSKPGVQTNFEQLNGCSSEDNKEVEYFDENEIDGEGFSDGGLN